jgi:hypothetical protein
MLSKIERTDNTMAKSKKDKQWPKVKRTENKQSLYRV